MCQHRFYHCVDCGEPQAAEPDSLCQACEAAEEELEQYILAKHDAEIAWGELTAEMRGNRQTSHNLQP